jgi:membrane protein required for colicin V production
VAFLESLPFNVVDVGVVVLILVSGFLAFFRGFITEALAVTGWVGATIVTVVAFAPAQTLATKYFADIISLQLLIDVGTGILLFVVSLIVFSMILRATARLVRSKEANPFDRALGFAFGLLRGLVMLAVVWLLITAIVPEERLPDDILEASTLPMIRASGAFLLQLAPSSLHKPEDGPLKKTRSFNLNGVDSHDFAAATSYKSAVDRSPCPCGHQS